MSLCIDVCTDTVLVTRSMSVRCRAAIRFQRGSALAFNKYIDAYREGGREGRWFCTSLNRTMPSERLRATGSDGERRPAAAGPAVS